MERKLPQLSVPQTVHVVQSLSLLQSPSPAQRLPLQVLALFPPHVVQEGEALRKAVARRRRRKRADGGRPHPAASLRLARPIGGSTAMRPAADLQGHMAVVGSITACLTRHQPPLLVGRPRSIPRISSEALTE